MATRSSCSVSVLVGNFLQCNKPLLLALALSSCNSAPTIDRRDVETEADRVEGRLNAAIKRIEKLEARAPATAMLSPTDKDFQYLDTDIGRLAVSIQKVTPLANGSEIELKVGNTSSASIERLKYHIAWGPVDAQGLALSDQANSADRTIDMPLFSGSWNTVTVPLANVPPNRLGYVELSDVEVSRIVLTPR